MFAVVPDHCAVSICPFLILRLASCLLQMPMYPIGVTTWYAKSHMLSVTVLTSEQGSGFKNLPWDSPRNCLTRAIDLL